jgi:predicted Fe-Mo cluster-binding NifX family protein
MQICIPVLEDQGLNSLVCGHFGSAPAFMIVDTDSGRYRLIENLNQHHTHGACQPLAAITGQSVDGIVVGGIGMGALMKLRGVGIDVFRAVHPTVSETVAAFTAGTLQRVGDDQACAGHHGDRQG